MACAMTDTSSARSRSSGGDSRAEQYRSGGRESEEHLLPSDGDCDHDDGWLKKDKISRWQVVILHTSLTLLYTVIFAVALYSVNRQPGCDDDVVFEPYNAKYEARVFDHDHSVYVGKPSKELDKAWAKLLNNSYIRITETEMSHIVGRKNQAIALPDGGYFASPNVYHNLHCIKRLHHYMYEDHYFPETTPEQHKLNEFHNHHCLDMLRQSVMCSGDVQLLTMKWMKTASIPTANFSMPHKCVNWDQLEKWTAGRKIEHLMDPGYLMHPTLGPAYPGGHGDSIGELRETEKL